MLEGPSKESSFNISFTLQELESARLSGQDSTLAPDDIIYPMIEHFQSSRKLTFLSTQSFIRGRFFPILGWRLRISSSKTI